MFLVKNIVLAKINKRYLIEKVFCFMINANAKEFLRPRNVFYIYKNFGLFIV